MATARSVVLGLLLAAASPALAQQRTVALKPWWTGPEPAPPPCVSKPGGAGRCDARGNWIVPAPNGGSHVYAVGGATRFVPPTVDPEAETDGGAG